MELALGKFGDLRPCHSVRLHREAERGPTEARAPHSCRCPPAKSLGSWQHWDSIQGRFPDYTLGNKNKKKNHQKQLAEFLDI